jgi:2-methylcitrate dehydratase PrpD
LKPYCCCGAHHPYIDAMRMVRHRLPDIISVDAYVQAMTQTLADNPNAQQNGTTNIEELQFSLALQMGMAVLGKGNGYAAHRSFLDGEIDIGPQSEVTAFARRIKVIHSPDLDTRFPFNFVGEVDVHFRDQTTQHIFLDGAKGMPNQPFTPAEHREKLDELTFGPLGQARALEMYDLIEQLDPELPVTDLTKYLRCE